MTFFSSQILSKKKFPDTSKFQGCPTCGRINSRLLITWLREGGGGEVEEKWRRGGSVVGKKRYGRRGEEDLDKRYGKSGCRRGRVMWERGGGDVGKRWGRGEGDLREK